MSEKIYLANGVDGSKRSGPNTIQRKQKSLKSGGMADQLDKLKIGEYLLLPNDRYTLPNVFTEVKRYNEYSIGSEFELRICFGFQFDLEEKPFKFIKVKRIS